ncbi:hypothetical protein K9F62_04105 [Desulfovibrio sp. JY]|nr:hypothetical protein K9F62_04105 [Desulfovibrio sp. JY]
MIVFTRASASSRLFFPATPHRRTSAAILACVLIFAAVRAVGVGMAQMPFNGWDELPHIAVAYYAGVKGRLPTARTPMPRELIPFIVAHSHPTASLCMLRGIAAKPYPGTDPSCTVEPEKRFDMFLYEAQQGPLFYRLAGLFCPGADPGKMLAWVDGVRAANALLLLGTLILWRVVLGRWLPSKGALSWLPDGVLLLLASFSYVTYNFVRFANDGLALFCGSAALAVYVVWIKPRRPGGVGMLWRTALLGGLAGLAVLAKATILPLALTLGLVLCLPAVARRIGWRKRLAALAGPAGFLCGYVALAGTYHLHYLLRYGRLTGMQEAIMAYKHSYGFVKLLLAIPKLDYGFFRNPLLYNSTVHLAGWSGVDSPDWLNLGFKTAVSGCVLAFLAALVRRENRMRVAGALRAAPEMPLLWLLCALALLYHALSATLVWGFPTSGGWYAMAGLPVLFAALVGGASLLGPRVGLGALLFLTFLFNAGAMGGTYDSLLTQETGLGDFYKAARIAAGHHALPGLDLKYVVIAECVLLAAALSLTMGRVLDAAVAPVDSDHAARHDLDCYCSQGVILLPTARPIPKQAQAGGASLASSSAQRA